MPVAVVLPVSQLLHLVVRGFADFHIFVNTLFSHVCCLVVVCISVSIYNNSEDAIPKTKKKALIVRAFMMVTTLWCLSNAISLEDDH